MSVLASALSCERAGVGAAAEVTAEGERTTKTPNAMVVEGNTDGGDDGLGTETDKQMIVSQTSDSS